MQEGGDREARRAYARLYYQRNKERIKALADRHKDKRKAQQRRYYQENKEKVRAQIEVYRAANKDKINARARRKRAECKEFAESEKGRHMKRYTTSRRYRLRVLATNAKYRSKAVGIQVDDSCFDPILASPPDACACCGNELDYQGNRTPRSPSIDRIHNDFGYIVGNVAVICFRCNMLKRNGTIAEFESILTYMRRVEFPGPVESDSTPPKAFWKTQPAA